MIILYSFLLLVYTVTRRRLIVVSQQSSTESAPQKPPPELSSAADFYGLFYTTAKPSGHSEEFKVSIDRPRLESVLTPIPDQGHTANDNRFQRGRH